MTFQPVIGLEVHAELATRTKMFCACPVVDPARAAPNQAVCPVCAGLPGVLPVVNQRAVELALRVAVALECEIPPTSLFARKNYFYPDLPKGYQISQYEYPLAVNGRLTVDTSSGERTIRIRRVHLEEDTGKLTHVTQAAESYTLVDLNRAGVPLLEIVSEPDMHTLDEVRAYAAGLRDLLRAVGASSGDMEKGALRFEANLSLRPAGSSGLGTRVEIKNLNSFRSLERALAYQIGQQTATLAGGGRVEQQTLGWDEENEVTFPRRSKEDADDYRYFPEPDLPPLAVDAAWVAQVRQRLPELPRARALRLAREYDLPPAEARRLAEDADIAAYFEQAARAAADVPPRTLAAWITGEVFAWLNQPGAALAEVKVTPGALAELAQSVQRGEINLPTAKAVLAEMLARGGAPAAIIAGGDLSQISDAGFIAELVSRVLAEHPQELQSYRAGKTTLANWFFGQVMQRAGGRANPQVVRAELEKQLAAEH